MNPNDRNSNQQQQQSSKPDSGKNAGALPSDNSGNQKHGSDTNPGQSDFGGKDKDKQRDVNAPGTNKEGGMKSSPNQQGNDSNRR